MILASKLMADEPDERLAAKKCLEAVELGEDNYRIGHTKARK